MYYVNRSTNSCIEDSHYFNKKKSASSHICKYVFCFDEQQFKMGPSCPDSEWVFSCKTKQDIKTIPFGSTVSSHPPTDSSQNIKSP